MSIKIETKYQSGEKVYVISKGVLVPCQILTISRIVHPNSAAQQIFYSVYGEDVLDAYEESYIYSSPTEADIRIFSRVNEEQVQ